MTDEADRYGLAARFVLIASLLLAVLGIVLLAGVVPSEYIGGQATLLGSLLMIVAAADAALGVWLMKKGAQ
ncbi:MAG: hypothetical protein ACYTF9_10210 [Planctomycetota bacterium]|jgi:hypothetical protein